MADDASSPLSGRVPAPSADATPMMAQYLEIKAANADSLLFYRMGDFYEMFFDDAAIASRALGIALTKRGKHLGEDIPMCGVPVHAADDYLQRLIAQGFLARSPRSRCSTPAPTISSPRCSASRRATVPSPR
jgi:DNA mismatch repair protein MutS